MTETAYETLPEIEPAEPKASVGTVVMKFGGHVGRRPGEDPSASRSGSSPPRSGARRRRGRLGDGLAHRRALAPRARGLAAADAARARHADLRRRADLDARSWRWRSTTSARARSRSPARRPGSSPTPPTARRRSSRSRRDRIHDALDDGAHRDRRRLPGRLHGRDITTLGRGGSDTTAVALAAALGADVCEIYTDVDGVFTADPRIVPNARKLHAVSYEEMLEMAASGAQGAPAPLGRVRAQPRRDGARPLDVHREPGTWIREEDERMLEKAMISGVTHTARGSRVRRRGRRRRPRSSRRWRRPRSTSTRSSRWTPRSSSPPPRRPAAGGRRAGLARRSTYVQEDGPRQGRASSGPG